MYCIQKETVSSSPEKFSNCGGVLVSVEDPAKNFFLPTPDAQIFSPTRSYEHSSTL
jgi:hypothetical protein